MGIDASDRGAVQAAATPATGVRLYTRAPVTLSWLSKSVVPVARAVNDHGPAVVYLRRGWLHGPHVDIVARNVGGQAPDWHEIGRRLDAGPLATDKALTEETYLAQAREFGRLEAVPPPYLPMREHGTVQLLGPDDVGSREARLDQFQEVIFSVLGKPMLNMIDELAEDPARGTVRLAEAFLALADTHFLGPAYGVFSLRSHVEAFLSWAAPSRDVRPAFAQRLAIDAEQLRVVTEERISGRPSPAAAAWRTALGYCSGALDSAVASGTLTLELLDSVTDNIDSTAMGPPGAPDVVPRGRSPHTAFHQAVDESGVVDEPLQWFAAYRLLINLFYQQLPLLTVSPLQRYYMCYAIAETVDEVLGESWQDRLQRQQARAVGEAG